MSAGLGYLIVDETLDNQTCNLVMDVITNCVFTIFDDFRLTFSIFLYFCVVSLSEKLSIFLETEFLPNEFHL